jgi:acetolactate synthase-1/2/3 large subunit
MNNQYLGMVRQWQELFFENRYAATNLACKDNCYWPDFVKLAEAYGLRGIRVQKPEEVEIALKSAKNEKESVIVEIMIEPESNVLPMLNPGGAVNLFLSRRKENKSIYDWFKRLPRSESEAIDFKLEIHEEDDLGVYFE